MANVVDGAQERLRDNKPFNKYNRDTFYTQDQVY